METLKHSQGEHLHQQSSYLVCSQHPCVRSSTQSSSLKSWNYQTHALHSVNLDRYRPVSDEALPVSNLLTMVPSTSSAPKGPWKVSRWEGSYTQRQHSRRITALGNAGAGRSTPGTPGIRTSEPAFPGKGSKSSYGKPLHGQKAQRGVTGDTNCLEP